MELNLSYNNFVKESKNKKYYSSYLNKLKGNSKDEHENTFRYSLFNEYKYQIPQFYLSHSNNIKGFHDIHSNIKLYNVRYNYLKKILEFNKSTLKIPTTNLDLKFPKDDNLIFKHLDFHKAIDFEYLIKNKKIYKNLDEFRLNQNLYNKITSNIFIKILNEKLTSKEKIIIEKIYRDLHKLCKSILKYKYVFGILGYKRLFFTDDFIDIKKNKNNKNNSNKYVLINSIKNINANENNNNYNKLNTSLYDYTNLYQPYNISKNIVENKKKIEEHLHSFHNLSLKLSQNSFTNVFDLLNIILDQEYHIMNFILYFNDIDSFEKILKQDNKIKKYIQRNLMNFSSHKNTYMKPVPSETRGLNLFKIPHYNVKDFFKKKNQVNLNENQNQGNNPGTKPDQNQSNNQGTKPGNNRGQS